MFHIISPLYFNHVYINMYKTTWLIYVYYIHINLVMYIDIYIHLVIYIGLFNICNQIYIKFD